MSTIKMVLWMSLALAGCSKKDKPAEDKGAKPTETAAKDEAKPAEPAKPAASGRAIPNSSGLVVDAPAKWKDNGIGGAAGMHLDADAGQFQVRELAAEELDQKMDAWKGDTEQIMFQKWVSAEETPDGWKAIYVLDKMTMKGEEMVKDGSTFAFHVRRKIGDKVYSCSGSAATQETATEAVELCNKVNAG